MKKRGTGWIPDYPDQSDYIIENAGEKLSNKVQSQGSTTSIEILAGKMSKILDALADQADILKLKKEDLTELRDDIDKEILGGIRFVTVDVHDVFKEGTTASAVLLINNYVQLILLNWPIGEDFWPDVTNTTLSKKTLAIIQKILAAQSSFQYEQVIDLDSWIYLETLATLAATTINLSSPSYAKGVIWKIRSNFLSSILGTSLEDFILPNSSNDTMIPKASINLFFELCQYLKYHPDLLTKVCSTTELELLQSQFIAYVYKLYNDIQDTIKNLSVAAVCFFEKVKEKTDDLIEGLPYDKYLDQFLLDFETSKTRLEEELKTSIEKVETVQIYINPYEKEQWTKLRNKFIDAVKKFNGELTKFPKDLEGIELQQIDKNTDNMMILLLHLMELPYSLSDFVDILSAAWKWQLPQIPCQIFERHIENIESPINDNLFKLVSESHGQYFGKSVDVTRNIVEIVAQILMPLGQHSNFSDAVCKALKKMQHLAREDNEMSLQNKQLIQEIFEQQVNPLRKDFAPVEDSILKDMTLSALEQSPLNNNRKQTLFRVRSEDDSSVRHQQIQFPIRQKFIKDNLVIRDKLSSTISPSKQVKTDEADKQKSEKKPDVYLKLPEFVDLSYWCSPVEDQRELNSCTAHTGIALLEYAQRKSSGTYIDASPLFLYKVTRNLMQKEGDSGASMRDTMKAMVAFGVCPEEHWSYDEAEFDQEPPAFCYSFAESFKALKYFRLDHGTISRSTLLAQVKVLLASEIPCAFGFTLYSSAYEDSNFELGHIPLPTSRDKVVGGHVVVAVGYHDRKIIKNSNGDQFEGALLIRNSWGSRWGQGGYGWMPYEYVTKGLTADWWSLLKAEWLASGSFGAGASAGDRDRGGGVQPGQTPPPSPI